MKQPAWMARVRRWLRHHLPAGLLWHPFEWFCTFMCAVSGIATVATPVESPSVEALLPEGFYRAWGGLLIIGAFAMARGLSSIRRTPDGGHYVVTRVPAYRLGLRLLATTVGVFIIAIYGYAGWDGLPASALPLAFVAACAGRLLAMDDR
jgi:hypothetical protein